MRTAKMIEGVFEFSKSKYGDLKTDVIIAVKVKMTKIFKSRINTNLKALYLMVKLMLRRMMEFLVRISCGCSSRESQLQRSNKMVELLL